MGSNPPDGTLIHYYQARRHLFGPLKLEILDAQGQVLTTLAASKRRGLSDFAARLEALHKQMGEERLREHAENVYWGGSAGGRADPVV